MTKQKYRPLLGRVLIEREVIKQTSGGIMLPENIQKRHAASKGKILALGETAGFTKTYDKDGIEQVIRILKEGDNVIFGKHAGTWLDATYQGDKALDDGTLFLCMDEDILAVVNEGV